jgi:hypothetical protein
MKTGRMEDKKDRNIERISGGYTGTWTFYVAYASVAVSQNDKRKQYCTS